MPPENFSTSKEDGFPNKDSVNRRDDWRIIRDTKLALTKLLAAEDTLEFLTSDSTPKVTFVMFDPAEGTRDMISTCCKQLDEHTEK